MCSAFSPLFFLIAHSLLEKTADHRRSQLLGGPMGTLVVVGLLLEVSGRRCENGLWVWALRTIAPAAGTGRLCVPPFPPGRCDAAAPPEPPPAHTGPDMGVLASLAIWE